MIHWLWNCSLLAVPVMSSCTAVVISLLFSYPCPLIVIATCCFRSHACPICDHTIHCTTSKPQKGNIQTTSCLHLHSYDVPTIGTIVNNDPTACINFPGVKSQCSNIITKPPCSKETATPTQVVLKYSVRGCMNRPFLTLAHLFTRDKRIECTTMWRTFSIVCVCYLVQVSLNQTTTKSQDESGQGIYFRCLLLEY